MLHPNGGRGCSDQAYILGNSWNWRSIGQAFCLSHSIHLSQLATTQGFLCREGHLMAVMMSCVGTPGFKFFHIQSWVKQKHLYYQVKTFQSRSSFFFYVKITSISDKTAGTAPSRLTSLAADISHYHWCYRDITILHSSRFARRSSSIIRLSVCETEEENILPKAGRQCKNHELYVYTQPETGKKPNCPLKSLQSVKSIFQN